MTARLWGALPNLYGDRIRIGVFIQSIFMGVLLLAAASLLVATPSEARGKGGSSGHSQHRLEKHKGENRRPGGSRIEKESGHKPGQDRKRREPKHSGHCKHQPGGCNHKDHKGRKFDRHYCLRHPYTEYCLERL